jgi:hypothetical protein
MRLPPTRDQLLTEILSQLRQWEKDKTQLQISLWHGSTAVTIFGTVAESKEEPGLFVFGNPEKGVFFATKVTQFDELALDREFTNEIHVHLGAKAGEILMISEERDPHALLRSLIHMVPQPKKPRLRRQTKRR